MAGTFLDPITNLPIEESTGRIKLPPITNPTLDIRRPLETEYDLFTFPEQNMADVRGMRQSGGEQLLYGLSNAVIGTSADIISGGSYLLDFEQTINLINGTEKEFGNFMSEAMDKVKEETELPIYRSKESRDYGGFTPWTAGFWADNMPSIFSTVSLMIPALGATKLTSTTAKLLGAERALGAVGAGVNEARALKGISGAVYSRYMENTMEAAGTMEQSYNDLLSRGYDEVTARNVAADAARQNWISNTSNLIFDVPQYMLMFKSFKGAKNMFGDIELSTMGKFGIQSGFESVEEAKQFISNKEAYRDAQIRAKTAEDDGSLWTQRVIDYAKDPEFWTSAFLGGLGGALMGGWQQYREAVQTKADNVRQNLTNQLLEKQRAVLLNDKTKFDESSDKAFMDMLHDHAIGNSIDVLERDLEALKNSPDFMTNLSDEEKQDVLTRINDKLQTVKDYREISEKVNNEFFRPGYEELRRIKSYNLTATRMLERLAAQNKKAIQDITYDEVTQGVIHSSIAELRNMEREMAIKKVKGIQDPALEKAIAERKKEILEDDTIFADIKTEEDLKKLYRTSQDINLTNELINKVSIESNIQALKEQNKNISTEEGQDKIKKQLDERRKEADKKQRERDLYSTSTKLAKGEKLTPEEEVFYNANKAAVDAKVAAKKAAVDEDPPIDPSKTSAKPVTPSTSQTKTSQEQDKKKKKETTPEEISGYTIQQYLTGEEVKVDDSFTVTSDENGLPVYTDSKGNSYKRTDGWFALAKGPDEDFKEKLAKKVDDIDFFEEDLDKFFLSGNNYFSTLWEYQLSEERKLLTSTFTRLHSQNPGEFPDIDSVLKAFPDAFPSMRAKKITEKITQLPNGEWQKYLKIVAGRFYNKAGEPTELPAGLYGTKPPIDIILEVTDPETGETLSMHHPRNPFYFNYKDSKGNLKLVDFSKITKEQFDNLFMIGYENPRRPTQEDFEIITSEWARSTAFFNSVDAYYEVQSQLPGFTGRIEYPVGDGYDMKITGKFSYPSTNRGFVPLESIESLKDAPIINFETNEMIRGPRPADVPATNKFSYPTGYYVLYQHPNGYKTWIRLSPKKVESVDQLLQAFEDTQKKLLEIPRDLVGTKEGNQMADQIVKDMNIFITSRTRFSASAGEKLDFRNIGFSAFKSSKSNTYLLQIETELDNTADDTTVKTRFVFAEGETDRTKIYVSAEELKKDLKSRGFPDLRLDSDFRVQVPKVIPEGADVNSYFDVTTDRDLVTFKLRFDFPQVGAPASRSGLPGFNLNEKKKESSSKKASANKSKKKQFVDRKKGESKDALKEAALADLTAEDLADDLAEKSMQEKQKKKTRNTTRNKRKSKKEKTVELTAEELAGEGVDKGLASMASELGRMFTPEELAAEKEEQKKKEPAKKKEQKDKGPKVQLSGEKIVYDMFSRDDLTYEDLSAEEKNAVDKVPGERKLEIYNELSKEEKVPLTKEQAKLKREEEAKKRQKALRGRRKNMLAEFAPTEPSNMQEALEVLRAELPDSISVEEMDPLMAKAEDGRIRLAYVLDNAVYLSRKATKKTAYHEAVHVVLDALLSDAKLASYRRLAKQEMNLTPEQLSVEINRLLATGDYEGMSLKDLENLVYDEYIADKRADYSSKRAARPSSVWVKLFDFIQRFVDFITGNKSLNALFRKIERGGFKKSEVLRKSDYAKNKLLGALSGAETQELISTVAGNYLLRSKEKNADGTRVTLDQIINEFRDMYDPYNPRNIEYLENHPEQEDILREYYFILDNEDPNNIDRRYLIDRVTKMAKSYGKVLTTEELEEIDEIFMEDVQEDHLKEQAYDKSVFENDPYLGLSGQLKAFFATTVYLSRDRFGNEIYKAVDPSFAYAKLLPILSRSVTSTDLVINKLGEYARTTEDASLLAIYDRIIRETGYSPENPNGTSKNAEMFLNRFKGAFAVKKKVFAQINHGKKGFKIHFLNKKSLGKVTNDSWFAGYSDSLIQTAMQTSPKERTTTEKAALQETENLLNSISQNWVSDSSQEQLLKVKDDINRLFNLFGFSPRLNDAYLNISLGIEGAGDKRDYKNIVFLSKGFFKGIQNALKSNTNLYATSKGGRRNMRGALKNIAEGTATFSSTDMTEVTPSFRVGDKTYYSYSHDDLTLSSVDLLKSKISKEYIEALKKDEYFKHNPLMQLSETAIMNLFDSLFLVNTVAVKNDNNGDLTLTGDMDNGTALATYLGMFAPHENIEETSRLYHLRQYEAKNTQYSAILPKMSLFQYENGAFQISEFAQNALYQMFIQETKRLQDKESGYLANKDKNGPQRIYFAYLQDLKLPKDFLENTEKSEYKAAIMRPLLEGFTELISQMEQAVLDSKVEKAVSKQVLEQLYNSPEEMRLYHYVGDMILNDFLWTNGLLQMIEGDIAWSKNYADFVKRGAGSIAAGLNFKGDHKIFFVDDAQKFYDENYGELKGKDLEELEKKNQKPKPTTINDGAVYSIVGSRIKDLEGNGRATDAQINALKRAENPLAGTGEFYEDENGNTKEILVYAPLTPEERTLIDLISQKEVIRGRSYEGKEVYEKMSVIFLSKDLTSKWNQKEQKWVPLNAGYKVLHDYREFLEKQFEEANREYTVHLASKSASKLFFPPSGTSVDITENSNVPFVVMSNEFRRLQVENETKDKRKIPFSLQVNGISTSELFTAEGKSLKEQKDQAFNAIKNALFNVVANMIRTENADGSIEPANLDIFLASKREQVEAAQNESQLLEMLETDKGEPEFSFNLPHLSKRFESLFVTSFKESFRHQMSGLKLTMVPGHGVELVFEIDSKGNEVRMITREEQASEFDNQYDDETKYKRRSLAFLSEGKRQVTVPNSDGTTSVVEESYIKPAEIMITRSQALIMGINTTDPSRPDYMQTILSRFPNQNYHSNAPAVIVDFLPEEYGEVIIGPDQLVLMMGADFDIDSLYTYMRDMYIKDGKTIMYGEETTEVDRYQGWKNWWLKNNKYIRDHRNNLIRENARIYELDNLIKKLAADAKSMKVTFNTATSQLLNKFENLAQHEYQIFNEEAGPRHNMVITNPELAEAFMLELTSGLDYRNVSNEVKALAFEYSRLMSEIMQKTFSDFSMPSSFEEWQSQGSPKSMGALNNDLFDSLWNIFTSGKLWPAYKDFLKDTVIKNTFDSIDKSTGFVQIGNSIPSKITAQRTNSGSKNLRGMVVSASQFGFWARENSIELTSDNYIDFLNAEGDLMTIKEYPTITPEMYADNPDEAEVKERILRKISDSGSQMVGLIIDDPKDPKIWALNWSENTLSQIADGISLGMDPDLLFSLFAMPIFRRMDLEISNRSRAISPVSSNFPKKEGKVAAFVYHQSILNTINAYIKTQEDTTKTRFTTAQYNSLTTPYELSIQDLRDPKNGFLNFKSVLTNKSVQSDIAKMPFDQLLKEYKFHSLQLKAMEIYEKLSNITTVRSNTVSKLMALNKTNGSVNADVNAFNDAYNEVEKQTVFKNLGEAVDNDIVMSGNVERIKKLQDYTGLYFITQTKFFNDIFPDLKNMLSFMTASREEYVRRLGLIYITSAMYRNMNKSDEFFKGTKLMDLMRPGSPYAMTIRRNQLVKKYADELRGNVFMNLVSIKAFNPKKLSEEDIENAVVEGTKANDNSLPLNFLVFDSFTKLPPKTQRAAMDGHASMLLSDVPEIREFALDVMPYIMAKDGMAFTSNSIAKIVNIEQYRDISDALKDLMASNKQGREELYGKSEEKVAEEFIENFIRTNAYQELGYLKFPNWSALNKGGVIIKSIKETQDKKSVMTGFTIKLNPNVDFNKISKTLNSQKTNISAEAYDEVNYPKYFIYRQSVGNDVSSRTYYFRGKLKSVQNGVATYSILTPFGKGTNRDLTSFFFTPNENAAVYQAMKGGKFKQIQELDSDQVPDLEDREPLLEESDKFESQEDILQDDAEPGDFLDRDDVDLISDEEGDIEMNIPETGAFDITKANNIVKDLGEDPLKCD